jgi:hypothetical protein
MKKIDLNIPTISLDGLPQMVVDRTNTLTNQAKTLASNLADILGTETEGRTLKLYGWYKKLQVGDILELDEADAADLESLINKTNRMQIFVKGQILEVIKSS